MLLYYQMRECRFSKDLVRSNSDGEDVDLEGMTYAEDLRGMVELMY